MKMIMWPTSNIKEPYHAHTYVYTYAQHIVGLQLAGLK